MIMNKIGHFLHVLTIDFSDFFLFWSVWKKPDMNSEFQKFHITIPEFILQKAKKFSTADIYKKFEKVMHVKERNESEIDSKVGLLINERLLHFPDQISGPGFASIRLENLLSILLMKCILMHGYSNLNIEWWTPMELGAKILRLKAFLKLIRTFIKILRNFPEKNKRVHLWVIIVIKRPLWISLKRML